MKLAEFIRAYANLSEGNRGLNSDLSWREVWQLLKEVGNL